MTIAQRAVFVNCAFDSTFKPMLDAIVFAVIRCGFEPRSALEADDASENRLAKIQRIVGECAYGIHDISRTEADGSPPLPRFNMPLELGLFLGAKRYGTAAQKRKAVLILDTEQYRYQRFMSDLAGQDIHAHGGDPLRAIAEVANWLRMQQPQQVSPGGRRIGEDYQAFRESLPNILVALDLHASDVSFSDFVAFVSRYLETI
jgi:hypothetical protein